MCNYTQPLTNVYLPLIGSILRQQTPQTTSYLRAVRVPHWRPLWMKLIQKTQPNTGQHGKKMLSLVYSVNQLHLIERHPSQNTSHCECVSFQVNIWGVFLGDVIAIKYPEFPFHLRFFIFVCFLSLSQLPGGEQWGCDRQVYPQAEAQQHWEPPESRTPIQQQHGAYISPIQTTSQTLQNSQRAAGRQVHSVHPPD